MNNEVHSALSGTATEENLNSAFGGEARSHMRYMLYADAARRSGDPVLARMLEDFAENEKEHAEIWLEYLGELGNNMNNITQIIASEDYENSVMYPEYADDAENEGFAEIADKMRMAANAEGSHSRMLGSYLASLKNGSRYSGDEDTEWHCTNCNYTLEGAVLPDRCPLCGHPKAYFVKED